MIRVRVRLESRVTYGGNSIRDLSIDLEADERLSWVTGEPKPRDEGRLGGRAIHGL